MFGLDFRALLPSMRSQSSGTHVSRLPQNVSFPINDFCNMTQIQAHRLLNGYTKDGVKI